MLHDDREAREEAEVHYFIEIFLVHTASNTCITTSNKKLLGFLFFLDPRLQPSRSERSGTSSQPWTWRTHTAKASSCCPLERAGRRGVLGCFGGSFYG